MDYRKPSSTEDKLLLLYASQQLGPATNLQLLQFMVDNALMDYITLQLSLAEMEAAGQLKRVAHPLGSLYAITHKGMDALTLFSARVPASRMQCVREAAPAWRQQIRTQKQVLSDFSQQPDGTYVLNLSLLEQERPLLSINLTLPTRPLANLFADGWTARAGQIYQYIMQTLGQDEPPSPYQEEETGDPTDGLGIEGER